MALRQALLAGVLLTILAGCYCPPPRPPVVAPLAAPYPYPRSIVVMPLYNHSPNEDFDPLVVTDILVSELSRWQGLTLLPTNQPLKLLAAQGRTHARSVEEAMQIALNLGVDGVVIGSVTEYSAYKPMKAAMTLQLFWVRADIYTQELDPLALSREAAPSERTYSFGTTPASQVQQVVDAAQNDVTQRVRAYAATRQGQDSPFGWRRYLVDSEAFMQFVCHDLVARLMEQELHRITVRVPA